MAVQAIIGSATVAEGAIASGFVSVVADCSARCRGHAGCFAVSFVLNIVVVNIGTSTVGGGGAMVAAAGQGG